MTDYTEAEAKTKWCPFARSYGFPPDIRIPVTINRWHGEPERECMCVASACMMWDWRQMPYRQSRGYPDDKRATVQPPRPSDVPASWEWVPFDPADDEYDPRWIEPEAEAATRRKGYCALSERGRP